MFVFNLPANSPENIFIYTHMRVMFIENRRVMKLIEFAMCMNIVKCKCHLL